MDSFHKTCICFGYQALVKKATKQPEMFLEDKWACKGEQMLAGGLIWMLHGPVFMWTGAHAHMYLWPRESVRKCVHTCLRAQSNPPQPAEVAGVPVSP